MLCVKIWKLELNFDGRFSEHFAVENVLKQRYLGASILFTLYFAIALSYAFWISEEGIYTEYRTTKNVINLTRLKFKMKMFSFNQPLYAGNCNRVSHYETGLHLIQLVIILASASTCKEKPVVMYEHACGSVSNLLNVFLCLRYLRFSIRSSFLEALYKIMVISIEKCICKFRG